MILFNIFNIIKMVLNYIGSKKTLLYYIKYVIKNNISTQKSLIFGDLFAGTGVVGDEMNIENNMNIISNDIEYYSYIINYANLKCKYTENLKLIIKNINKMESIKNGLIYYNFSPSGKNEYNRMFFTCENAQKIDTARQFIEEIKNELSDEEYIFLLASIIESADKVANVACVYGAFLKKFKNSALKEFKLQPIHKKKCIIGNNKIYNKNVIELTEFKYDIVYLDPPYNSRQYGGNYSQLNYLALYDPTIEIKGKTGIMNNYYKSKFSQKYNVEKEFENLIQNLNTKYILISYNNEGILSLEQLQNILKKKGKLKTYVLQYKKFQSQKTNSSLVNEYLHFVDCSNIGETETIYVEKEQIIN